jgi:hypothetical protein
MTSDFLTVREQIVCAITERYSSMISGQPAADPYTIQFDFVRRNPLDEESWKKFLTMGVHDTKEMVEVGPTRTDRFLSVMIEWRRMIMATEIVNNIGAASTIANEIMGNIQKRLWEDNTFGQLAIDVQEMGNEVYIEDFDRRQLSGVLEFRVHYRTMSNDPRAIA